MDTVTEPSVRDRQRAWYGENPLRVWRARLGVSMMGAATLLGVGMSAVQSWEQGVHQPSEESIALLATTMGVKPTTLSRKWRRWYANRPTL